METSKKTYKVVVVEDEELILNHIIEKIERASDRFIVAAFATDGINALEKIKEHMPQVLITDIRIPGMNGLELANEVHDRYPFIQTVIITGHADFNYAREALRMGVLEYLLKPVRGEELSHLLNKLASVLDSENDESLLAPLECAGVTQRHTYELVKEYIHNNFYKQINLQSLADELKFSPAYLTKIFKKYGDTTPVRYLTELRINTAAKLLSTTELPVSIIGERVGYQNQFYFSRIFKKNMNACPQEYRNMHKD